MTTTSANPDPKPQRRFLQFSLRTLFVLMTVFAVWFGWKMQKAREQKKAVEWVREMGGAVLYDYESSIGKSDPPGPGWLREIVGIDFMADVVAVNLGNTPVTDLTPLVGLKNLQSLWLVDTSISKAQIDALQETLPKCGVGWNPPDE